MLIQRDINVYEFHDMFRTAGRQANFSYEGLRVLFDYLDDYSDSIGQPLDLDVVALCCDFNEMSWRDVAECYDVPDLDDLDEEERIDVIRDYLQYNTSLCGEFEDGDNGVTFVFAYF